MGRLGSRPGSVEEGMMGPPGWFLRAGLTTRALSTASTRFFFFIFLRKGEEEGGGGEGSGCSKSSGVERQEGNHKWNKRDSLPSGVPLFAK